ncbi:MAG: Trp family transcriptional regulator [Patescibacteria group bacterium]
MKKTTKKSTEKSTEVKKKKNSPSVLSQNSADEIVQTFFQVITDLRSVQESQTFLLDFLSDSERLTFAKRLAIALELQSGKSYDAIRKEFGVSSATISSVAEMMKSEGLKLALKKISTEKWADQTSKNFFKLFKISQPL